MRYARYEENICVMTPFIDQENEFHLVFRLWDNFSQFWKVHRTTLPYSFQDFEVHQKRTV